MDALPRQAGLPAILPAPLAPQVVPHRRVDHNGLQRPADGRHAAPVLPPVYAAGGLLEPNQVPHAELPRHEHHILRPLPRRKFTPPSGPPPNYDSWLLQILMLDVTIIVSAFEINIAIIASNMPSIKALWLNWQGGTLNSSQRLKFSQYHQLSDLPLGSNLQGSAVSRRPNQNADNVSEVSLVMKDEIHAVVTDAGCYSASQGV